ncbi:MAG TPA: hypothetical protein VIQ76_19170 [Propionibacteriaceae bacterium]
MYRSLASAAGVLAIVAGLVVPGALFQQSSREGVMPPGQARHSYSLDTASSAIPSAADPAVTDIAQSTARSRATGAKAVSSSVATSNCDGCAGQSTVFQVVYFDGAGTATADNTAAAWSSCTGCVSSAVSVQLVVARRAQPLTANNRAVALNANCTQCKTTSAAIQFVIAGGSHRDLSAQATNMIAQIQKQLADRLSSSARSGGQRLQGPEAKAQVDDAAGRLAAIILSDIGSTITSRSVDVQVGQ